MRTLIIPCAGRSTRYSTPIPKYLLMHPSGNMMLYESIQGLPIKNFDKIVAIVLLEHMIDDTLSKIKKQFEEYNNFEICILNNDTSSASDSVSQCIRNMNIIGEIYIKDSDDYFFIEKAEPNQVCIYLLDKSENITPGNKSYIRKNRDEYVLTIVEKQVISSYFCCGLYSFDSAEEFVKTFDILNDTIKDEIFISHIIYKMILNGKMFTVNEVNDFIDWGTEKDWNIFKNNEAENKNKIK